MTINNEWTVENQSTGSVFTILSCEKSFDNSFIGENVAPFLELNGQDAESRWTVTSARLTFFADDGNTGQGVSIIGGPLAPLPICQ
jgi:hypothetical protein